MSGANKAVWADSQGGKVRIGVAEDYTPGADEVVIRLKTVAINPVDNAMLSMGIFVSSWPTLLGFDGAGEIVDAGSGISRVSIGQRVAAFFGGVQCGREGARSFQNFAVVKETALCPIPDHVTFEEATVFPLAAATAILGLYAYDFLALPLPTGKPSPTGKAIILWGGSTSVGISVIQLASASGIDVITTAGAKNLDLCKSLGATEALDYQDPNIVQHLASALKGRQLVGVLNAAFQGGGKKAVEGLAQLMSRTNAKLIAAAHPPPEDTSYPEGIKCAVFFAPDLFSKDEYQQQLKKVWMEFLPTALQSGQFKALPKAQIVGKGLDSVPEAMEIQSRGVSATKIIVPL